MPEQLTNAFCRTGANEWRRVLGHDATGVDADHETKTFHEVWLAGDANAAGPRGPNDARRLRWEELLVPLPELSGPARSYALTYRVHQDEVRLADVFRFEKRGMAERAWIPIPHRPALDYEAEVALLLHRSEPERFGFLLSNDLTDRAVQVRTHDRRNPAPGFSVAKSFPGALLIGPLLVIGGADVWPELEVQLTVNGELRQHLRARDCLMTPPEFYREAFSNAAGDWVLVLTGTAGGTIFQSPTPRQRLKLLVRSGFSKARAREAWLRRFNFLRIGDRLEMKSEILGGSHATIVASAE